MGCLRAHGGVTCPAPPQVGSAFPRLIVSWGPHRRWKHTERHAPSEMSVFGHRPTPELARQLHDRGSERF